MRGGRESRLHSPVKAILCWALNINPILRCASPGADPEREAADGQVHSVPCYPNHTVWDFKTQLGRQTGVSPYQQKLAYSTGGHLDLQDGAQLAIYGLRTGDTLLLVVKNEESIPVLLRSANNRTTTYHVLPSDTVGRFRAQVCAQERIQDDQFWLTYGSQTLEDGRTFSDDNICPGGTLMLNLLLRGGRVSPVNHLGHLG